MNTPIPAELSDPKTSLRAWERAFSAYAVQLERDHRAAGVALYRDGGQSLKIGGAK